MTPLPIDAYLPQVVDALSVARNLVLVAEPGAGKTTRVPPAIAESGVAGDGAVVMLQPRRVAARAAAERIASERNWRVGEEVGYQVRFERRIGPRTRIRVLTEAILARQLLADPELSGVGCVLLDEFHERSVHSDLAVALLREVQEAVRPDLRLVVMSATLDAGAVAAFLGPGTAVLEVPGRTHPVVVEHWERRGLSWEALLERAVVEAAASSDGHVLAFLPGAEEIRRAERSVRGRLPAGWEVLPLHGSLPFEQQRAAIAPSPRRKVILATNIAETSLTIDGVTTVVDSGLSRQVRFDVRRGLERLELGRISQASARQRAGRAGRTRPGRCVRLWSVKEHQELTAFDVPELHRVDPAPTLLTLLAWGVQDVRSFGWFERPAEAAMERGLGLLKMLGAVDARGAVTPVGRRMAELPLHPRLARLLVEATGTPWAEAAAATAAVLSEGGVRWRERGVPRAERRPSHLTVSDLHLHLEDLAYAERRGFSAELEDEGIDPQAARRAARVRDELLRRMGGEKVGGRPADGTPETVKLLRAFPDRVCVRREPDSAAGLMVGGVGVVLSAESGVRRGRLFLALDLRDDERQDQKQAEVTVAHGVDEAELDAAFPGMITVRRTALYDAERDKVVVRAERVYRELVLESRDDGGVSDELAAQALADALLERWAERLRRDDAAWALACRMRLARAHVPAPGGVSWPDVDDAATWREAAVAAATGRRRLAEIDLTALLRSRLVYPLDRWLDEQVPERWTLPRGHRVRIDYTASPPVLAVRLQELFGVTRTPTVAGGRVPLVLHLLSPGYKPVQVTQDLVSFWNNTYPQVRKELRARYPKHAWPEDPFAADAVRAASGPAVRGGKERT